MDTIYNIILVAKRIKGEKDGKKYNFISFSTVDKNGKKAKIKFTKAVKDIPNDEGSYEIEVNKKDINRDKSTVRAEYWVREIQSIKTYDGLASKDNTEDLPF